MAEVFANCSHEQGKIKERERNEEEGTRKGNGRIDRWRQGSREREGEEEKAKLE